MIRCVIEKVNETARLGLESSAFDGRVLLGLDRLRLNPVSQRHVTAGSRAGVWLIGCEPADGTARYCRECGDWLQCIGLVHAGHDNEGVDHHGRSESSPSLRGGVQEADRAVVTGTASRRRGSGRSTASRVPRCGVGCRGYVTAAPRKRPATALPRRTG